MKRADKNIVIPMAGRGIRFIERGYKLPKPLIPVLGRPMIEWAMMSIDYSNSLIIFLVLREHIENHQIDSYLKKILYGSDVIVIEVPEITEGQAITVLLSKDYIDNDKELIIFNCDTYCGCDIKKEIRKYPHAKGFISVFKDTNPKWSFAKVDSNGRVIEVAEKRPISNNATVGLYHFKHGKDFVWGAEEMIRKKIKTNNEFYVGPVYNELIARGDEIRTINSDFIWGLGTPEDIEYFENNYSKS